MNGEPKCPACGWEDYGPITSGSRVMSCGRCDHRHLDGGEVKPTKKVEVTLHANISHKDLHVIHAIETTGKEILSQDRKWGAGRNHTAALWMQILTEEVGEAAEEGNAVVFDDKDTNDMEDELIQVAAVAIQAVASLRRQRHENHST